MNFNNPISFGWRYNQKKSQAVIRKKSRVDFYISIIIAFLIIFIVSQLLGQIDRSVRVPFFDKDFTLVNPFEINRANAETIEAIKIIQSHKEINIVKGSEFTYTVGFKNLGEKIWKQKGIGKVELKIALPFDRETILRHKSWKDKSTPTLLREYYNKPGEIGYYKFTFKAPIIAGIFKEQFVLVRDDNEIIEGSKFEIVIKVFNSSQQLRKPYGEFVGVFINPKKEKKTPVGVAELCHNITPANYFSADPRMLAECYKIGISVTSQGIKYLRFSAPLPLSNTNDQASQNNELDQQTEENNEQIVIDNDNEVPEIIEIKLNNNHITAADIGKEFIVDLVYDQPMDTNSSPVGSGIINNLVSKKDPLYLFKLNNGKTKWVNENTLHIVFKIKNNKNVKLDPEDFQIIITGSKSINGIEQSPYLFDGVIYDFSINTTSNDDPAPEVIKIKFNKNKIKFLDIGKKLKVTITYSKPMNNTIRPKGKGSILKLTESKDPYYLLKYDDKNSGWKNKKTFEATFEILDNQNVVMNSDEITLTITGAIDELDNLQKPYIFNPVEIGFSVDTVFK